MKFTYLVYKEINGVWQLAAATQEEWNAILKENRRLPLEQRRRFIKDCIADGDEMDSLIMCLNFYLHTLNFLSRNSTFVML